MVSKLDPTNTVLTEKAAIILAEFLRQPEPYEERVQDYLHRVTTLSPQDWFREIRTTLVV